MLDSVNLQDVKEKLIEKLADCGWGNKLRTFIKSSEMDKILELLLKDALDNKRFTPKVKDMFNAFVECPYDTTRVVIIGQDPYPQAGVADGIAFSCGNTMKREASLRYIHKAIIDTVYNKQKDIKELSPDLTGWANQGVLLLNTSLTTEIGKIGKHFSIWNSFTEYLIDMLNASEQPIVWVFLGKKAQEYSELIGEKHIKLFATHPASAAYQKEQSWECNDVFNKVNEHLVQLQKDAINW